MKVTMTKVIDIKYQELVSEFFTSTELIPKRRLNKWIQRPGFGIRDDVNMMPALRGVAKIRPTGGRLHDICTWVKTGKDKGEGGREEVQICKSLPDII